VPDDILPPVPPGEERVVSVEKKGGLFSKLFSKKRDVSLEPLPQQEPSPLTITPKAAPDVPDNINLDNIRKQLGLQPAFDNLEAEVPEPPKLEPKATAKAKPVSKTSKESLGIEKQLFDFTEIPEPPKIKSQENKEVLEENVVEAPDKISKVPSKKSFKEEKTKEVSRPVDWASEVKAEDKNKPASDFTSEVELASADEKTNKGSDFTKEVLPEAEKSSAPPKHEFLAEVHPEHVKELAKELKRKEFAAKKGIHYEPDVSLEEEPIASGKAVGEEVKIESVIKEIVDEELEDSGYAPLEEKYEEKHEKHHLDHEHHIEHEHHIDHEKSAENHTQAQASRSLIDAEKDLRLKLTAKIREEEREKLEEELEKEKLTMQKELDEQKKTVESEKRALEKEKQQLEQEKISSAGKINKYDFKEKMIRKEKSDFAAEKEEFQKEIKRLAEEKEEFEEQKEEAHSLLKKLPQLRKDYESLNEKMKHLYDKIKGLDDKEAGLKKIEKNIEDKKKLLGEAQGRLEDTEQKIKQEGFSDYLEMEVKEEPLISPKFEEKDLLKQTHLEIYNMIDECKELVRKGSISEAKQGYMDLRRVYSDVKIQGPEKDSLYNAIRELYDDIKLAEMEAASGVQ